MNMIDTKNTLLFGFENDYGVLLIKNNKYKIDIYDLFRIINFKNQQNNSKFDITCFCMNMSFTYEQFVLNKNNFEDYNITHKNNDIFDLRRSNLIYNIKQNMFYSKLNKVKKEHGVNYSISINDDKSTGYIINSCKKKYKFNLDNLLELITLKKCILSDKIIVKKKYSLIDFIFNIGPFYEYDILYKNGDIKDIRRDNIEIKYKPKYIIDDENKYIIKDKKNNSYIFDYDKFILIAELSKHYKIINEFDNDKKYPYYLYNNKKVDYLQIVTNINDKNILFHFKNGNFNDLRNNNIIPYHRYHYEMIKLYPGAVYIQGHVNTKGKDANIMKNPLWKVNNIYFVLCENNKLFQIDQKSFELLKKYEKNNNIKMSYYVNCHGYVVCNPTKLYIHQVITDCYGNGKGTKFISVDHIDQNPLNNCFSNLRISDRKTQEDNSKGIKEGTKRARKKSAKPLPQEITQDMLPKYVCYYKQTLNKEKGTYRDFFQIEKHPKLGPKKRIASTKSMKVSIIDKLNDIKDKLNKLENDT